MDEGKILQQALEICSRSPFTLEDLHDLVGVLVEWKGSDYPIPDTVYIGPFRLNWVRRLVAVLSASGE